MQKTRSRVEENTVFVFNQLSRSFHLSARKICPNYSSHRCHLSSGVEVHLKAMQSWKKHFLHARGCWHLMSMVFYRQLVVLLTPKSRRLCAKSNHEMSKSCSRPGSLLTTL